MGDFKTELTRAWQISRLAGISFRYHCLRVIGTAMDPVGGTKDQKAAQGLGRALTKYMRLDVEVVGAEKLDGLANYVLLPNHSSYIDWALILGHFPTPPRFVAQNGISRVPVVGSYLRARGVLIDRRRGVEARRAIAEALEMDCRWPLLIFPEGTRSKDGEIKAFKRAGITLVAESGRPMVPMTLVGTWETFAPTARVIDRGRRVKMIIHDPIDPTVLGSEAAVLEVERVIRESYAAHRPSILGPAHSA